jgi:hypothetical protein
MAIAPEPWQRSLKMTAPMRAEDRLCPRACQQGYNFLFKAESHARILLGNIMPDRFVSLAADSRGRQQIDCRAICGGE